MADNLSLRTANAVVAVQTVDNTGASRGHMPIHGIANSTGANIASVDSSNRLATLDADVKALLQNGLTGNYETVAASQTAQVLGATGAAGDWIEHILVVPASTSPGNVLLLDGVTSITVFAGGATSVADLKPFLIPLKMAAATAWKITTGANVSVIGVGKFT